MKYKKPVLIVTIDFELIYGSILKINKIREKNLKLIENKLDKVINAIINIFKNNYIKSTWGFVGNLIDKEFHYPLDPLKKYYIELYNKFSTSKFSRLYKAIDILNLLLSSNLDFELAFHSFFHIPYTYKNFGKEQIKLEMKLLNKLRQSLNISVKSFIFPQNKINYLTIIKKNNFMYYRGKAPLINSLILYFYDKFPLKIGLEKIWLFFSRSSKIKNKKGLMNLPATIYIKNGISLTLWKKLVEISIDKAIYKNQLVHIYFHIHNLIQEEKTEENIRIIKDIFNFIGNKIKNYEIESKKMCDF
ncbi:MAG: hypothetical protein ACTSVV_14245 [Promethearchaeota archaeon]